MGYTGRVQLQAAEVEVDVVAESLPAAEAARIRFTRWIFALIDSAPAFVTPLRTALRIRPRCFRTVRPTFTISGIRLRCQCRQVKT